jgi:hypothetical protein
MISSHLPPRSWVTHPPQWVTLWFLDFNSVAATQCTGKPHGLIPNLIPSCRAEGPTVAT